MASDRQSNLDRCASHDCTGGWSSSTVLSQHDAVTDRWSNGGDTGDCTSINNSPLLSANRFALPSLDVLHSIVGKAVHAISSGSVQFCMDDTMFTPNAPPPNSGLWRAASNQFFPRSTRLISNSTQYDQNVTFSSCK